MAGERDTAKDSLGPLLYKRTSRLCIAVYRLSDFFETEEPLRQALRESAVAILRSVMSFTSQNPERPGELLKDITDKLNLLSSYFDVLLAAGYVSLENSQIVKDELLSLMDMTEKYFHSHFGYVAALREFLGTVEESLPLPRASNPIPEPGGSRNIAPVQNDRRAKIIEYIKKHGPSTIKDIGSVIRGCSEKTIQRELSTLVLANIVRREGERRWSKYMVT
ncbi:MAG TPA: hypothetical protein VJB98_01785 [Candidatus Paceibacterota bacterium]